MSTQSTKYPHLTAKFGDVALYEPSRAGQKSCWELRTEGLIPLGLEAAEKQAEKDPDSLCIVQFFKDEYMIACKAPALKQ